MQNNAGVVKLRREHLTVEREVVIVVVHRPSGYSSLKYESLAAKIEGQNRGTQMLNVEVRSAESGDFPSGR